MTDSRSASTKHKVLLVDDDQALLEGLYRAHRKSYEITIACGGLAGLKELNENGPFAVVVSDFAMPVMDGAKFLSRVRETWPDTTRVMLSGNADMQTAIDAVNRGQVFQFLSKPIGPERFVSCMDAAIERHQLVLAERRLLEETLRGSIEVLCDVLGLANPMAFGQAKRIQGYATQLAEAVGHEDVWMVETAALLSQIGVVAIPTEILDRHGSGEACSPEHEEIWRSHPETAQRLLAKIPRLGEVAEMIGQQAKRFDSYEADGRDTPVARGGQIISAALAFDDGLNSEADRRALLRSMKADSGRFAPDLLEHLHRVSLPADATKEVWVGVDELRIGMILDQDVLTNGGTMITTAGTLVTEGMLDRLRNYKNVGGVQTPIRVLVTIGSTTASAA